jgi:hypothetical protein
MEPLAVMTWSCESESLTQGLDKDSNFKFPTLGLHPFQEKASEQLLNHGFIVSCLTRGTPIFYSNICSNPPSVFLLLGHSPFLNLILSRISSFQTRNIQSTNMFLRTHFWNYYRNYSLCGLVVRVPGYWSRGAGSIPGATRFSVK